MILAVILAAHEACAETRTYTPKQIKVFGLHSMPEDMFIDSLGIKPGKSFDALKLRAGIKRLFHTGYFEDISVETADPAGEVINVKVEERKIISDIKVTGNENFSDNFYKRMLGLELDARFDAASVESALPELKKRLYNLGFRKSSIKWSVEQFKYPLVRINVDIIEGEPEIIRQINIKGDAEEIGYHMRLSVGDIYDVTQMEKTRDSLMAAYKKADRVNTAFSYSYSAGILDASHNPGIELDINFHGNQSISSSRLRDELFFYDRNEFSNELLEESISMLTSLYNSDGYIKAQVIPVVVSEQNRILLDIYINEGIRHTLNSMTFTNTTLDSKRLHDILGIKPGDAYREESIASVAGTLEDFYRSLGYVYAKVSEPEIKINSDKGLVDVNYIINEGTRVKITSIEIRNTKAFSPDDLKAKLIIKPDNSFNDVDILDSRRIIYSTYAKEGYLDAKVTVTTDIKNGSAAVVFVVDEGEKIFFGKTIVTGNTTTRLKVITREFEHHEGMPADYSRILSEKQRLFRLGLFSEVETELVESGSNTRDVIYRLKESDHGFVEFGFGYGEYEKARGFAEIGYRNLWGLNRQATLRTELSTLEHRIMATFTEPRFLNSSTPLKALLLHEQRTEKNLDTKETRYKLQRDTATVGIENRLSSTVTSELYYDFSVVKTTDVQPDVVLSREDTGTLIISGLRAGIIYDKRDNPFEPASGYVAGISAKWTTKMLLSESEFIKASAYLNNFFSLGKRVVLALSARGGYGKGIGDTKELPLVERFFLGGRTTVRGYEQDTLGPRGSDNNPTGGNVFAMANMEIRTDLGKGIGIVNFVDTGDVWRKISDMSMSDLKYTAGIGLRYKTPVGPIRIDYGVKLNKRIERESRGELHFSLGHAF